MQKEEEKTKPKRTTKKNVEVTSTATTTTFTVDPETSETVTTITGGHVTTPGSHVTTSTPGSHVGGPGGKLPLIELEIEERLSECRGDRLWKKVLKMMGGEYAIALWVPRRGR
jgi:hypothetical protein